MAPCLCEQEVSVTVRSVVVDGPGPTAGAPGPSPPEADPGGVRIPGAHRAARHALRVAVLVGLYLFYAYARGRHGQGASPQSFQVAVAHAEDVAGLTSFLLPERVLQGQLLEHQLLVRAAGAYYGSGHFLLTTAVAGWLALRRGLLFDRLATVLAATTFLGVAVFALYPVAPPRLMPHGLATVDTLAVHGGLLSYDHGVLENISDPLAALPSLHLAWATWVALVLWASRRRWVRVLGVLHPVLTVAAVLITGNHWYVDVAAGTALTLLVAVVVRRVWPVSPPTDGEGPHLAARRTRRRTRAQHRSQPASRLLHHNNVIATDGESYRMREARSRSGGRPSTRC
jgi:hypothetical protein